MWEEQSRSKGKVRQVKSSKKEKVIECYENHTVCLQQAAGHELPYVWIRFQHGIIIIAVEVKVEDTKSEYISCPVVQHGTSVK